MRTSKFAAILFSLVLATQPIVGQPFKTFKFTQDRVKIGNLTFVPPKDWVPTNATSSSLLAFAPPDLPPGKTCRVRVYADQVSTETFSAWFTRRWNALMAGKPKLRTSDVLTQKAGDAEITVRSGAFQENGSESYALIIGSAIAGHFILASYEANDFPTIEKYQNPVYAMFATMDLPGISNPGKVDPSKKDPPTKGPASKDPIGTNPAKSPTKTGPYRAGDPKVENERVARLIQIAAALQDEKQDAGALLTEASKLCGFAIWTEDGGKVAEPTGTPRLKLAVTESEIKEYAEMFRNGNSVKLNDLIGMLDVVYKGVGSEDSCGPIALDWLQNGARSGNPSVRALVTFLQALGAYREGGSESNFSSGDVKLDPIQSLLILRVLTQDIGGALKKSIEKDKPPEIFASLSPADDDGPGAGEDGYAGTVTTLWDTVTEETGKGKSYAEKAAKANAILSIVKFIATYAYLKGKVTVASPGQPLVRTKDQHAGGERNIVAKFWIDGTKVTDWMKDHRKLVVLAGLDIDMPHTGALKGVPTAWATDQNQLVANKLIQTPIGSGQNLANVPTDDKGEATVLWQGCPQQVKLDPTKVMPVEKQVKISVTPQVKEIKVQQDLVDAVTGAIGIKGGPSGFLSPLMEMLYRMKWTGTQSMVLQVRDWQQADSIGQLTMSTKETWTEFSSSTVVRISINRSLAYSDVGMQMLGGEPPHPLDPRALTQFPDKVRKQVEAGYQQQLELAKTPQFFGMKPGATVASINDLQYQRGSDGCDQTEATETTSWKGALDRPFETAGAMADHYQVKVDTEKKIAYVTAQSPITIKYLHIIEPGHGLHIANDEKPTREEKDTGMGIMTGLHLVAPYSESKPIEIPLQVTNVINSDALNYHGAVSVPYKFGPGDRFKGNMIVSYSVTRKIVKAK